MLILLELPFLEALVVVSLGLVQIQYGLNDMFIFTHKLPTQDMSNTLTEEIKLLQIVRPRRTIYLSQIPQQIAKFTVDIYIMIKLPLDRLLSGGTHFAFNNGEGGPLGRHYLYLIKYVGCQDARHQSRFHSLFISEEVELSINNA